MKSLVAASVAAIALVLPASAASAESSSPSDYRPECEQAYTGLQPLWDAVLDPGKALFGPLETGLCGEQKHTPQ